MSTPMKKTNTTAASEKSFVSTKTVSNDPIRSKRCMIQNYLVIWADANIDPSNDDCQKALTQLQKVVSQLNFFTTLAECIEFLNRLDKEKVFLILSGSFGQTLVPDIHNMSQVDVIYIFCGNETRHKKWAKQWYKIQGIFTSIGPICKALAKAAYQCDNENISMSFVSKQAIEIVDGDSEKGNLNQLEPSYMYSVIFKEIILKMEDDNAKSLKELSKYCLEQKVEKDEIDYFVHEYDKKTPIYWYSCQMFIYGMLNRALRTLDMGTMAKLGFFIRHLHRQLERLHEEQVGQFQKQFLVYRGQGLSQEDFNHLREIQDGLLSFNNFLSTSKEQRVALGFANDVLGKSPTVLAVLFIVTIHPSKITRTTTPYAMINDYSAFPIEEEILFTMHTVFRVRDIKQTTTNDRLWEVQLTLTDDSDPQLANLTNCIKKEIDGTGWHSMATLMYKVGDFTRAEELYNELLSNSTDDIDKANIYHGLGLVYKSMGNYLKTLEFYEKAMKIREIILPPNHKSLAISYNDIAVVYEIMSQYEKALEFYKKSNKIVQEILPPNDPDLASSYNNIALLYGNMGDYSKALEFYEKAVEIEEISLPPNHPDLAGTFNNIGHTHNKMGNYSKALEFFGKSNKIAQQTLPANHPNLATSYNNIAMLYYDMGHYSKALEFFEKSNKIAQQSLPADDTHWAMLYNRIGETHSKMGNYVKALEFFEKSIEIEEISLPPNHPGLAISYDKIAATYCSMDKYSKALEFYEKSVKMKEIALPPNHPNLAASYNNIGLMCKSMNNYSKALEFYEKSMKIIETTMPSNHPDLATSYSNIGGVYFAKGDHKKAAEYLDQALTIHKMSLPASHPIIQRMTQSVKQLKEMG